MAQSRRYPPFGSQLTCFLGVSIGNFIAPLPRWGGKGKESKRSSPQALNTSAQQFNNNNNNKKISKEGRALDWLAEEPQRKTDENHWLGRELETRLGCLHRWRGCLAANPLGTRKSEVREGRMEEEDEKAKLRQCTWAGRG